MRRTAVGIDLGTSDVFAANVGRKGVEIVQNSVSERRTPALVSFTNRRRLLGDAASAQVKSNYKNSCRGLKHIVGRAWDSPEIEAERFWSLCALGKADQADDAGYMVSYRGEGKCVSATVCLSMLVTSIVATCKEWTKMDVNDVVLAIPSYYTERVRQACLDALRIAGVNCLRLVHESTAIALAWRFERRIEDKTPVLVAFCSAGHSGLLVAVARFHNGAVQILGEAYDLAVSGRSMDRILMERFAESLVKQGAPDPLGSAKARLKLEEAASKVKKTLSVTTEALGTAECIVEDYDLNCNVQRAWFEEQCAPLAEKAKATVARALAAAGIAVEDLTTVEIVGGLSRIPLVQRTLKEAVGGRELSTTLNADEAVARGCAWAAAMLSPLIRLEQIPVKEGGTPAVALEWKDSEAVEAEGSEEAGDGRRRLTVFEAHAGPNVEAEVNLRCKGPLEVRAVHLGEDGSEAEELGCWTLPFPAKEMEDIELQVAVDLNGVFSITKAAICKGKEEAAAAAAAAAVEAEAAAVAAVEEAAAAKAAAEVEAAVRVEAALKAAAEEEEAEAAAKAVAEAQADAAAAGDDAGKTDEAAEAAGDADQGASGEQPAEASPKDASEAGPEPEAEASPGSAEATEASAEAPSGQEAPSAEEEMTPDLSGGEAGEKGKQGFNWKFWQWRRGGKDKAAAPVADPKQKRKVGGSSAAVVVKREPVDIKPVRRPGFSKDILVAAEKAEVAYRKTDAAVVEAENRRNDYETHIFSLRERLSSGDALLKTYASADEQKALGTDLEEAEAWTYEHTEEEAPVYAERLKALTKLEKECATRRTNLEAIDEKVKALKAGIKRYKATANSSTFDYIAKEKRESITQECDTNTEWLVGLEKKQAALQKWDAPVFSTTELSMRSNTLTKNATKILSEPRPKPPEAEKEEKDGKKGKKKKGDSDGKDKQGDKSGEKDAEGDGAGADAEGDANGKKEEEVAAPKRPRWQLYLGGALIVVLLLPIVGVCAGYGKPYGVESPLLWSPIAWMLPGGEGDEFDEAMPHEADDEAPEEPLADEEPPQADEEPPAAEEAAGEPAESGAGAVGDEQEL